MTFLALALPALLCFSTVALAGQINIVTSSGPKWELQESARAKFNGFLERERVRLLKELPGLDFPASFGDMNSAVPIYFSADSSKFRNRQMACSFLEKLRKSMTSSEQSELNSLTKPGKICIQADLEADKQLEWTQKMARFLWQAKWIANAGEKVSMQTFLGRNLAIPKAFDRLQIIAMKNSTFDAWGIAQSQRDLDFFASIPNIRDVLATMEKFDPNDSATFGGLGPEFQKFVEKDPFNAANLLRSQPTVYISNGWPPNGMVEVLAHEYGHIYRRLVSKHYSGDDKKLIWLNDEVHEEAAAEACAWMSLFPLYQTYPEIEIYHIAKLVLMNKSKNFHYLGASSLQDFFHTSKSNFEKLKLLDTSEDFGKFLKQNAIHSLVEKGLPQEAVVSAVFSSSHQ